MLQICYEVDSKGFIISEHVLDVGEDNDGTVTFEGKELIAVSIKETDVFFNPKWNGLEWIEGATQEEIDELMKVEPAPPTAEQRIEELEAVVNLIILGGL